MGGRKIPKHSGDLPGDISEFRRCEGEYFCHGEGEDLHAHKRGVRQV